MTKIIRTLLCFVPVQYLAAQVISPLSPSKEYVYLNGGVVAVEVPVQPAGSIAISSLSPSTVTLVTGGSAQVLTLTLTRTNFTGNVTLTISGLPSGVTAIVNSPGIGNTGTIELTAGNAAAVLNQTIPVTLVGQGLSSVSTSFVLSVALPPTADSVTPNTGSGTNQSFTFKYSSLSGYGYLNFVYALINGSLDGNNGCFAYYLPANNGLYLLNDAATTSAGPLTPGSAGTLSNSRCTLNGAGSSVTGTGNTLSVTLALAFKPSFLGAQKVYGYAGDNSSQVSGWQTLGTWSTGTQLDIWWPAPDGVHLSGTHPFKIVVAGLALGQYNAYWQVDGGQLVSMADSRDPNNPNADHKEASVDLSGWTWKPSGTGGWGPYTVNFLARDLNGNVIVQKSMTIYVQPSL